MILEINSDNMLEMMHNAIVNQKHCTFWGIHHNGIILVPSAKVVDEQMCYEMGYKVYEAFDLYGGSIVANAGDIDICNFGYKYNNFLQKFGDSFVKWLQSKGLNAEFVKNDILVDGYKVCGTCITNYNKIDYTAIHIGINTNLEDIKKICRKPMQKIPKGLSEFDITTEEVKNWVVNFAEEYELSLNKPLFLK